MNTNPIEMIPSARRLMESLRDIGYDLPAAVADLVDNSLDARRRTSMSISSTTATVAGSGSPTTARG